MEEKAEANKVTVDTFSTQRNGSEKMIDKFVNLTINNAEKNLIKKLANSTINGVRNNMIEKVANLTIKNAGNDSNGENARDLQVQFAGNPAENFHKNLLSGWEIGITHEEVPVLVTLM